MAWLENRCCKLPLQPSLLPPVSLFASIFRSNIHPGILPASSSHWAFFFSVMIKGSCQELLRSSPFRNWVEREIMVNWNMYWWATRGWYFKDYFNQPSRAEIGTAVAILEVGALVSSLLVGRIGDLIGRRKTICYGSIVFFIGGGFQTFATGLPMMMVGRVIAGLGVGALSTIVPVYQSEISVFLYDYPWWNC